MIQIKLKKKCKYGKRGSVISVTRNIAHTIIDMGLGTVYKPSSNYKNRMMRTWR